MKNLDGEEIEKAVRYQKIVRHDWDKAIGYFVWAGIIASIGILILVFEGLRAIMIKKSYFAFYVISVACIITILGYLNVLTTRKVWWVKQK